MTFQQIIRARLLALLDAHGFSMTGLARAMGRSHMWLLRKLDPEQGDPRSMTLRDVDEVLEHLDVSGSVLLSPVLLPGDRELLIFTKKIRSQSGVSEVFSSSGPATKRLVGQGLMLETGEGFQTTKAGLEALTTQE